VNLSINKNIGTGNIQSLVSKLVPLSTPMKKKRKWSIWYWNWLLLQLYK